MPAGEASSIARAVHVLYLPLPATLQPALRFDGPDSKLADAEAGRLNLISKPN